MRGLFLLLLLGSYGLGFEIVGAKLIWVSQSTLMNLGIRLRFSLSMHLLHFEGELLVFGLILVKGLVLQMHLELIFV